MAGGGGITSREQTLSVLSAVKNHEDLSLKLSSLRQAKDILLSAEPSSLVGELFPYIVELQGSNEVLVRKILLELMEELGLKVMDQSSVFMPVFLALLKDGASSIVRKSIVSGTNFYRGVVKEMALQYHQSVKVERWLEDLWSWMVKFKNAICEIGLEDGPITTKLLAIKFLEMNVLIFTSDSNDDETSSNEVEGQNLNITRVVGGQPMLDPGSLTLEANMSLEYLPDILGSAKTLPGCVTITVISCLAVIARKRPMHYTKILSALLGFDPNFETPGSHAASIKYSLRIAFLGFLNCTHPCIVKSRDKLVKAADEVVREVDKIVKNTERASRAKEDHISNPFLPVAGGLNKKRSILQDVDSKGNKDELPSKRTCYLPVGNAQNYPEHDEFPLMQNDELPSLSGPSFTASQVKVSNVPTTTYQQSPVFQSQAVTPFSSAEAIGAPLKSASALSVDLERDPRRAESLRNTLPASDESFGRFLGEAPLLPDSALKLLKDLCCSEGVDKHVCDGDFTQDLGGDGAFNYRSHGTTIIAKHTSSFVELVVDGKASVDLHDVNDNPVVEKGMDADKTRVLWDRVAVVGAGDGDLIDEIIDELKKVPADEGWDAEDSAYYGKFLLDGNYLENDGEAALFFASYLDVPQLYHISKEDPVQKVENNWWSIGCGSKYAARYLKSEFGYQGQHESLYDRLNGYLSAMVSACTNNFGTADRIKVHHITKHNEIPGDNGINLVCDVHEHDVQKEMNEDMLIDTLEIEAKKTWMEMKVQRRGASENSN